MAAGVDRSASPLSVPDSEEIFSFEEDSDLLKRISAIPIIGIPVSMIQQASIKSKIAKSQEKSEWIEATYVINDYKKSAITRNLLSAALVIAGIAKGVLKTNFMIGAVIFIGAAALNAYQIHQNEKLRSDFARHGIDSKSFIH